MVHIAHRDRAEVAQYRRRALERPIPIAQPEFHIILREQQVRLAVMIEVREEQLRRQGTGCVGQSRPDLGRQVLECAVPIAQVRIKLRECGIASRAEDHEIHLPVVIDVPALHNRRVR
jgi:hypothetical protein